MQQAVIGMKELQAKLARLQGPVTKTMVGKALRKGSKVILKQAKVNTGTMVGGSTGSQLAKNFVVRMFKNPRRNWHGSFVAIKADALDFIYINKGDKFRHYIPAAIEYGHTFPYMRGSKFKHVPAIPFMRHSADIAGNVAKRAVVDEMYKVVTKELSK